MNHALPPKRPRLAPKRIASAAAAALGAALLTYPGAATAQDTGIDCGALGESPMADGMEAALETAVACDTEVRIAAVSGPYETVYATPQGQLHLVQTVDPTQDYQDQGLADPTLVEADGTLAPAGSPIEFTFSGNDTTAPLMRTKAGNLDWNGDQPVPTVSGTTAVYEGLTEGLDLRIDAGISSTDLRFTIDGPDAWQAVASNLTATANVYDNSLYAGHPRENLGDLATWEQSTPFTIRDADDAVHSVTLTDGDGTSFSLGLDQAVLDTAAYPLTLTTTWTYHLFGVSEWGAVTSASPDLSLFRGEAGLDQPYFEAAGQAADAVVGGYCDTLADPECVEEAQAVLYWNFWRSKVYTVGPSSSFRFSNTAATFSVEASDGAACTAPDLQSSSIYRPSTRWSNQPALGSRPAFSGHCENGTAVYDLSGSTFSTGSLVNTLVMTDSAETALLKGGSARLDAYFDIRAYRVSMSSCKTSASDPARRVGSEVPYGGFTAELWRPDLVDQNLTWTATIENVATGEIVASSDPVELVSGTAAKFYFDVDDGLYSVEHAVNGLVQSDLTCYYLVDTQRPEFVDINVPAGPHFVGDIVPVEVTVADAGFPNGFSELTIFCLGDNDCQPTEAVLTDDTTVTFEMEITKSGTTSWMLQMYDEARYVTYSDEIHITASDNRSDYNGDNHQDFFAIRKSDGQLMFYAGKGDGSFASGAPLGSGWNKMDIVMAGDLTGDGKPDLLARDTKSGNLYTYPGNGSGGFGARITAGSGWNSLGVFTSNGDFNGDGKTDLYAVGKTDGKLYFYPGKGNGTFGSRTAVGSGWGVMDTISTFADFNLDGKPDLLADNHLEGEYFVYYGQGGGKVGSPERISDSFEEGSLSTAQYNEIFAAGDYDENGTKEVVSIDALTGNLVTHSFDELGNPVYPPRVVDDGWGGYSLPGITVDRTYDFNASATTDLVARHGSTGTVYVYTGNGSGGFGTRIGWGTSMSNMNLLETAGDFTGDGIPDLLARVASTGSLYVMPGTGDGEFYYEGRIRVGTGWNSMSAIVSGQDFNGDGKIDIVAREKSTGYLWLYPGKGDGHVGTRVKIGSGWNAMRDITAAGDLDHDGHADVIAVKAADNCMYFYGGRGDGTLKPGVKTSCNWLGYDSVASVGDFNSDGHADWVSRRKSDGALYLYKGNGAGGYSSRALIGTGWNSMNIIA